MQGRLALSANLATSDGSSALFLDDLLSACVKTSDILNGLSKLTPNEEIIKQYQNANQLTAKELDEVEAEIARAEETYDAYVELVRTGTICMSRA